MIPKASALLPSISSITAILAVMALGALRHKGTEYSPMADGWRCPECHLILAPDVREHRCEPPEAGVSVRPVVAPYSPSTGTHTWPAGSGFVTIPDVGQGSTVLWTGTGGAGGGAGGWTSPDEASSFTITATNACNAYGDCGHASCAVAVREPLRLIAEDAA
jgi:hypothetical protein